MQASEKAPKVFFPPERVAAQLLTAEESEVVAEVPRHINAVKELSKRLMQQGTEMQPRRQGIKQVALQPRHMCDGISCMRGCMCCVDVEADTTYCASEGMLHTLTMHYLHCRHACMHTCVTSMTSCSSIPGALLWRNSYILS